MTDCNEMQELGLDSAGRRAHLERCASCRLEEKWRSDFAELPPAPEDGELERRLVARVLERPAAVARPARPKRTRYVVMALAATLLVGLAFAANLGREAPPPENVIVEVPAPPPGPSPAPVIVPPVRAEEPVVEKKKEPSAAPAPSASAAPSAEDLFTRANSARRAGNVDQALSLYRELQRARPNSREALASRALVGRLLLDRGDARGALPEFDAYLASGGTLGEEALAGRALALERLGRTSEERAAWQTLLERHPGTLHRAHAEERLAE
jgi:hypothetical protein